MVRTEIRDFVLSKVTPVIIFGGIIFMAVLFVVDIAQVDNHEPRQAISSSIIIDDTYTIAQRYADNGQLGNALATYSKIINDDVSSGEEKAWHEKGKILIRLGYCNDAVNHYQNYVNRFPYSDRGSEGYELAKMC